MTEAEKNEIVGLVMTQISSQAVDFDIATEQPQANDLLTAVRQTSPGAYVGVTIKWDDVARIATELANQAAERAEQAETNANNILERVQSKGTEITNFVATSKAEIETQKNESVNAVKSVYQTDLDELKGDLVNLNDSALKNRVVTSNNICNPNDVIENHFISNDGELISVNGYSVSGYIPINGNNVIANGLMSSSNPMYLIYDEYKNFLRAITAINTYIYQDGDTYIRVNFRDSHSGSNRQVNYGDTLLDYDVYTEKSIESLYDIGSSNIVIVGKNSKYKNVQSALDAITDDSETNQYTIILMQGEYPSFKMTGYSRIRYISIIGVDKNTTIVKDDRGAYDYPPAEIFTNGTVENISFINKATSETYAPSGRQPFAYAMHTDFGSERVTFKNCYFYSNAGSAVGCGTWEDGILEFINCTFESECDNTFGENGKGAFFCHTATDNNRTNQKLVLDNCLCVSKTESIGGRLAVISGYTGGNYEYLIKNTGFFGINGANVSITDPNQDLFSIYNFGNVPQTLN